MAEQCRDNYIIRIYRRDGDDPDKVVGLVEAIDGGGKTSFTGLRELCEILNPDQQKGRSQIRRKES